MLKFSEDDVQKLAEEFYKTRNPRLIVDIIRKLRPMIDKEVAKYTNSTIPNITIKSYAEKILADSLPKYNPSKGRVTTWAKSQLRQLSRFVQKNEFVRVPESRRQKAQKYKQKIDALKTELGREPSIAEVADHLGVSLSEASRIVSEINPFVSSGNLEFDEIEKTDPRLASIINMVYYGLSPNEQVVFEYLMGYKGKKKVNSTGEIARLTGMSPSMVSQLKKRISRKIQDMMDLM